MKTLITLLLMVVSVHATVFVVTDGTTFTGPISTILQDGRQAALTLSESLSSDEMYFLWPTNSYGYGEPVAINKTEAWWVGPDTASIGDTFSIYGQNLWLADDSYLFYSNTTTDAYGWLTNSADSNPYKVDYTVPAGWANGDYLLWAHNGRGQEFGWADSIELTVETAYSWSANIFDVAKDYGADGSDEVDDLAAFVAAYDAASDGDTHLSPMGA